MATVNHRTRTNSATLTNISNNTFSIFTQAFSNFYLPLLLKKFSIDTITDKNQFERQWQAMSDYAIQNYYSIYGNYVGAVLRKTKRIYDAQLVKFQK